MDKKKIYIAGCGGMLGEGFYQVFKDDYILKCTDKDVNEDWLSFLDFRDRQKYHDDVVAFKPDYLFHLGAYTDLEWCENHEEETYNNNTLAVENAVSIANELDIPILYISTAGIFDGKKEVYNDWDTPNPMCAYAKSKYYGERYVVEHAKQYYVCRAGWMMGGGPKKDKKFIQKIMKQIKEGAKTIYAVTDKAGTPTYTHDFAKTCKELINSDLYGVYNCTCKGETTRYDVAKKIVSIMNKDIKVIAVNSSFFKKDYFAPRPSSESLLTLKLDLRNLNKMRDWETSLIEYITNYYKNYFDE